MPDSIIEDTATTPAISTQDESLENQSLQNANEVLNRLISAVKRQVIGRDDVIELAVIALIADGHVLLGGGAAMGHAPLRHYGDADRLPRGGLFGAPHAGAAGGYERRVFRR